LNWISVEDDLPEPGQFVVVYRKIADGLISGCIYSPIPKEQIVCSPWLLIDNISRSRCKYVTHWFLVEELPNELD